MRHRDRRIVLLANILAVAAGLYRGQDAAAAVCRQPALFVVVAASLRQLLSFFVVWTFDEGVVRRARVPRTGGWSFY